MTRLTILNVAFPLAPAGPDAVGGAEQVVTLLDAALTRAGHSSVVVACEGSRVEGALVSTPRYAGALTGQVGESAQAEHLAAIRRAISRYAPHLVHMHGLDFWACLPPPPIPVLATLHLPPSWYPARVFQLERPNTRLNCVSATQARACPLSPILLPPIGNGVDGARFEIPLAKRNFALALGRICPEKGFHHALDAARAAGIPLLLAGEVFRYEAHQRYFAEEIAPRLDALRRYIGPAGFRRKRRLLTQARCLLAPSLAPETSSLVAMEAFACGTPVIAFPNGALAEIVEHGRTGFLVDDARQMAEAIHKVDTLNPDECRRAARERFSAARTFSRYLQLYERLIEQFAVPEIPSLHAR